jgi:hypothetical protein
LRGHDEREWTWGHEFRDEREKLCALVDVTIAVRPAPGREAPPVRPAPGR